MRQFFSVPGLVVPRYGTEEFVGARRTGAGFVWSPDPVGISDEELQRYVREYGQALGRGEIRERVERRSKRAK